MAKQKVTFEFDDDGKLIMPERIINRQKNDATKQVDLEWAYTELLDKVEKIFVKAMDNAAKRVRLGDACDENDLARWLTLVDAAHDLWDEVYGKFSDANVKVNEYMSR